METAQLQYLKAQIEEVIKGIPERRSAAIDQASRGFDREKPKMYYRGAEEAYKYVIELIDFVSKESK